MAVAQGYGKTVTSGSVFAYDTGDTVNSYKGQPTVNAFGTYPTDLYGWVNGGNQVTLSRDTIPSPVGNTPLKMVCNGNDPYISTYGGTGNNIAAAASGQTWTISVWAKANQNTTGAIFHFGANSSGNIIDFNATGISLTTEWTRYTYTRTFTDGNVVAIQARLDGPDSFQSGVVIWWDGLQVEQKAYATQFVAGTRSATQGLLPLVGNSTLDLSNMSFTSNAQIVFDGTDDYINTTKTASNLGIYDAPYTMEAVFKVTNTISGDNMVFGTDQTAYRQGMHNGLRNGNIYFAHYSADYAAGSVALNEMVHVLWVYDGTTAFIYKNGVLQGSSNIASFIGTTNIQVGRSWAYFQGGEIPVAKIYNRALSAGEVRQNYLHYKTRFNLG
jgi:hypothetical protein